MKAFVTGATGFVGLNLCPVLCRKGWQVSALVRSAAKGEALRQIGCPLIEGDLDNSRAMFRGARDADVVFHLAGITKALNKREFLRVNARGTGRLVHVLKRSGFKGRLLLLSSLAAAGPAPRGRLRNEGDPARPVSDYGRSKLAGERAVQAAEGHFPVTILRPGAIYGPHEHEMFQVIKPLARTGWAVGCGPLIRLQMTHVDDVVGALVAAAESPNALTSTYFVNDPRVWRIDRVMELMGDAVGRRVRQLQLPSAVGWAVAGAIECGNRIARKPLSPFNLDKMREVTAGDWIADSARFSADTGWKAKWELADGLKQTIEWYRAEGWL